MHRDLLLKKSTMVSASKYTGGKEMELGRIVIWIRGRGYAVADMDGAVGSED
jgi:hypothetical protein